MNLKKFTWYIFGKVVLLSLALFGIFYLMAQLNTGALFSDPNSPAAILLGLPAQR